MFRILPIVALFAMMVSPLALAAGKKPAASVESAGSGQPDANAVDITEIKKHLQVLTDGKQHYVAIIPFGDFYTHFYFLLQDAVAAPGLLALARQQGQLLLRGSAARAREQQELPALRWDARQSQAA
jgi:hypothetical protein